MPAEPTTAPQASAGYRWARGQFWLGMGGGAFFLLLDGYFFVLGHFHLNARFEPDNHPDPLGGAALMAFSSIFWAAWAVASFGYAWCAAKSRLFLTAEGVRLQGGFRSVSIRWGDISGVQRKPDCDLPNRLVIRTPDRRIRLDSHGYLPADWVEILSVIETRFPMAFQPARPPTETPGIVPLPASPQDNRLVGFLAGPPPRQVPPALLRAARRESSAFSLIMVGFCYVALMGVITGLMLSRGLWHDWQLEGGAAHADGRVMGVSQGDRPDRNGGTIYGYAFTYQLPDGIERKGLSYTTGRRWQEGEGVAIEYLAVDPAVARIAGSRLMKSGITRNQALGPNYLGLLLSLALVFLGFRARWRARWLLEHGRLGDAFVQSVMSTPRRFRGKPVFEIALRCAEAGNAPIIRKKYRPEHVQFFQARLASGQPVFVLFDPARPKHAIFPETLV